MKTKLFLAVAFLLALSSATFAQKAYQEGSNVINAGIDLGDTYYGWGYSSIAISGSFEHGITDNISAGGILGYGTSTYNAPDYSVKYTNVLIGARGSYHFLTTDVWDPYAGADLGYVTLSHSYSGSIDPGYGYVGSGLKLWLHGGARYYFSPGVGAFGELKIGSSIILGLGVSFKF